MSNAPAIGSPMTAHHFNLILESLAFREERFPEESFQMRLGVVLLNFGDRYAEAWCVGGEWSGLKEDLPRTSGIPKCPNGHVLTQGKGLRLGWVEA